MPDSNFIDYVKIFCASGHGGAGSMHLHRAKYIPKEKLVALLGKHDSFDLLDSLGIKNLNGKIKIKVKSHNQK